MRVLCRAVLVGLLLCAACGMGATLPQDHEYQRQLRRYMATLRDADFAVEAKPFTVPPGAMTAEERFRLTILDSETPPFAGGTPCLRGEVQYERVFVADRAVLVTFTKPVRAKLSPEVWQDHYQSRVMCRTILVDLLGGGGARAIPAT